MQTIGDMILDFNVCLNTRLIPDFAPLARKKLHDRAKNLHP